MNKVCLSFLLIFCCFSCLHQTDDITLTTNPFDLDFSGSLYEIEELKCIKAQDQSGNDSVFVKFRMIDDEVIKLQDSNEGTGQNILDLRLKPKTGGKAIGLLRIGQYIVGEGKVYEYHFGVSSDFLLNPIFEFYLYRKPYLFPSEVWYSWEHEVTCQ